MLSFLWPYFFFIIMIVPFFLYRFSSSDLNKKRIQIAIKVPFFYRFSEIKVEKIRKEFLGKLIFFSMWLFFSLTAMRPVVFDEPIFSKKEVRNIMLLMDVSGSMQQQDFDLNGQPITRLEIVKNVVQDFIDKRKGDRIGMVLFGSEAYSYTPLSLDKKTLKEFLKEVDIGIAGTATAIGEAIALGIQDTQEIPSDNKITILLSDGFNNAGQVSVEEAIHLAKKQGNKIYTIGVGSDPKWVESFLGFQQMVDFSKDLDEKTLKQIAQETGGRYFRAKSSEELIEIYQEIDKLEKRKEDEISFRPQKEYFYIPLILGMLCFLIFIKIR